MCKHKGAEKPTNMKVQWLGLSNDRLEVTVSNYCVTSYKRFMYRSNLNCTACSCVNSFKLSSCASLFKLQIKTMSLRVCR